MPPEIVIHYRDPIEVAAYILMNPNVFIYFPNEIHINYEVLLKSGLQAFGDLYTSKMVQRY